ADVTTLDGQKLNGDLVSIDEKAVVIKTASGEVTTPVPRMLVVELPGAATPAKMPDKYFDVELIDGSLFHCQQFRLKGKNAELVILPNKKLTVPMTSVLYILADAQDVAIQKEWQTIMEDRGRIDRFFVRKGNRLDGLEGTFGDADANGKNISFSK